jgi:hypothetical protein
MSIVWKPVKIAFSIIPILLYIIYQIISGITTFKPSIRLFVIYSILYGLVIIFSITGAALNIKRYVDINKDIKANNRPKNYYKKSHKILVLVSGIINLIIGVLLFMGVNLF